VFVEPLAAACEILEQVDVRKIQEAAVLGDGKLAQLIARVLGTLIPRVVMYGKHERKLALARRAGIVTRSSCRDLADCCKRNYHRRLTLRAIREGDCAAPLWQGRSDAAHYAPVSTWRRAKSHRFRAATWRNQNLAC
jgi:hypothetical protein